MTEKTFRDSLFEGVKRFCRTEQAAHNLVDFTIDLIASDVIGVPTEDDSNGRYNLKNEQRAIIGRKTRASSEDS